MKELGLLKQLEEEDGMTSRHEQTKERNSKDKPSIQRVKKHNAKSKSEQESQTCDICNFSPVSYTPRTIPDNINGTKKPNRDETEDESDELKGQIKVTNNKMSKCPNTDNKTKRFPLGPESMHFRSDKHKNIEARSNGHLENTLRPMSSITSGLSSVSSMSSIGPYLKHAEVRRRLRLASAGAYVDHDDALDSQVNENYHPISDPKEMIKRTGSGRQALFANSFAQLQLQRTHDHYEKEYHDQVTAIDFARRQLERSRTSLQKEVKKIKSAKGRPSYIGGLPSAPMLPDISDRNAGRETHSRSIYRMQLFHNEDTRRLSRRYTPPENRLNTAQTDTSLQRDDLQDPINIIDHSRELNGKSHGSLFLTQSDALTPSDKVSSVRPVSIV